MTVLFHVDESRDKRYHFHVGLLSDGPSTAAVESQVIDLLADAHEAGACRSDAELHASDIFHSQKAWERANIQQSVDVFDNALRILVDNKVEVIARGVNLKAFAKRYGDDADPYTWTFSNLLERLNERLLTLGTYGIVIADEQAEHRKYLQQETARAKQFGTGGYRDQKLRQILDTAHFVDSRLSQMTQLADVAGFVLRRRASRPSEPDARLEACMSRWSALVRSAVPEPDGMYYSIRY